MMHDLPNGYPGCMIASVCFSERLFEQKAQVLNRQVMFAWR